MEELGNLMEQMSLHTFDIGKYYWVDVTHIVDPRNFFVRPTAYRRFMPMLQEYGGSIQPSELNLGKVVVYRSRKLHMCLRGQIIAINREDNCCDLYAIDNGFKELSVLLRHMRNPLHNFSVQSLITECELRNCVPHDGNFTKDAIDAMKYFVGDERAKMLVCTNSNNKLKVDLLNTCPDDIATLMALTGYTNLGLLVQPAQKYLTVKNFTFKHREFKVNDIINVRCQWGTSLDDFYVALDDDYKNYLRERPDFKDYCREQAAINTHDIKAGEVIAVLSHKTTYYERATIIDVNEPNSKAVVQLMDWGTRVEACWSTLKAIKAEKYFQYPVCAIYCKAEEEQQIDELQKVLYPGFQFQIKIKSPGKKFNTPNIVQIVTPLPRN